MDTIVAISTALSPGGIGIVRVSGNEAAEMVGAVFVVKGQSSEKTLIENPLMMNFGTFNGEDFKDKGYAVFFPANKSFTGEDTVELYLHGGVRILKGAVRTLINRGARPAAAGEFTKRAYLNGRMSLSDAEGVADMINAESAAGLRAAYRLMQGGVASKVNAIAEKLLVVISTLEASLDYPDEMEDEVMPALDDNLPEIAKDVDDLLSTAYLGKIAKSGVNVVIAGKPNVGKSSLLNALIGEDRAIVTDVAGTTRDTLSGSVEVDGVMLNFTDTAGLRQSDDTVESIGVERARKAIDGADLVLHVVVKGEEDNIDFDVQDKEILTIYNKCDIFTTDKCDGDFQVSAKTGEGVKELAKSIAQKYACGMPEGLDLITCERHISALNRAKSALESAIKQNNATIDCVLIDLRSAYNSLLEITGGTATEDIVDRIFSAFCVGK